MLIISSSYQIAKRHIFLIYNQSANSTKKYQIGCRLINL